MQEEKNAIIKQGIAFSSKNLVYKYLKNNENAFLKLITEQQQGKWRVVKWIDTQDSNQYIVAALLTTKTSGKEVVSDIVK